MRAFLAAAAAVAVFGLAVCSAQSDRTFERTLSVSGHVSLDVTTDAGGISITQGGSGAVRIRGILKAQHGFFGAGGNVEDRMRKLAENPPIQQSGNTIRAGSVGDKALLKGLSLRFEIVAPADTQVRARADSGGIRVEGVRGPVDCQTDSGGIHAVSIGSDVRAAADSGGIEIRDVKGMVYARADSGGIEALDVTGSIDVQTDSGGIRLSQTAANTIRARAESGGAHVKLARSGGYEIRAISESGRVTVPELTAKGTVTRNRGEGRVRGGGSLVDVKVDSGNIEIE